MKRRDGRASQGSRRWSFTTTRRALREQGVRVLGVVEGIHGDGGVEGAVRERDVAAVEPRHRDARPRPRLHLDAKGAQAGAQAEEALGEAAVSAADVEDAAGGGQ